MTPDIQKTFKFRIFPSKAQTNKLENTLFLCRDLYNAALQERRDAYKINRVSLNYYSQANQLPEIKQINLDYKDVHSQILQNVIKRVDNSFQNFFRRVKTKKEKAGFPRFQNRFKYNSFTFAQSGFSLVDGKLQLSKLGKLKIKLHRKVTGKIKTLTINRDLCGRWFACFTVIIAKEILSTLDKAVGIDVGISTFCKLSDETEIDNPRFFNRSSHILAIAQRKLAKQPLRSKERYKKRKVVAKIYNKIKNRRDNFAHQISYFIVKNYDKIFFESLNIKEMLKDNYLAKSISDVAWHKLIQYTLYKAENAGRVVGTVNAAYTSQICSSCGELVKKDLSIRIHHCVSCGLEICRDLNAARNILARGLASLGDLP